MIRSIITIISLLVALSATEAQTTSERLSGWRCGDGGPAREACVEPAGAFATANELYFADQNLNEIRKINFSNNKIERVVGDGTPGFSGDGGHPFNAKLRGPGDVFVKDDVIYLSDTFNHRIRQVKDGVITTIQGTGAGNPLMAPTGIAVGPDNFLYVADTSRQRVVKFGPVPCTGQCPNFQVVAGITNVPAGGNDGVVSFAELGDNGPATAAHLWQPLDVAFDGNDLLIADTTNNRIRKVSNGIITTIAGTARCHIGLNECSSDAQCSGNGNFCHVNKPGMIDNIPAVSALINNPAQVVVQGDTIYFADKGNNLIRKIENGIIVKTFGTQSGMGSSPVDTGDPFTQPITSPNMVAANSGFVFAGTNVDKVIFAVNMMLETPTSTRVATNTETPTLTSVPATKTSTVFRSPTATQAVLAATATFTETVTLTSTRTATATQTTTATQTHTATRTASPTNSPSVEPSDTATQTATKTLTVTPTHSPRPTDTPIATATASVAPTEEFFISGKITYYSNGASVNNVSIDGVLVESEYKIPISGMTIVTLSKTNDEGIALSSLDSAWMLSYVAGMMSLTPEQKSKGDLTMELGITALDAARALAYAAGVDTPPRWLQCGSWGFEPKFDESEGIMAIKVGECDAWVVTYLEGRNYENQDWSAWVWGDITGNWSP